MEAPGDGLLVSFHANFVSTWSNIYENVTLCYLCLVKGVPRC